MDRPYKFSASILLDSDGGFARLKGPCSLNVDLRVADIASGGPFFVRKFLSRGKDPTVVAPALGDSGKITIPHQHPDAEDIIRW